MKPVFSDEERARLEAMPRYESGETTLLGRRFHFVDARSMLYAAHEIFEREIYRFPCERPAPRILDAGANVGLATIYFKSLFPSARITAYEADPEIAKALKRNLAEFELTDVEVVAAALWNEETEIEFHVEGADGGRAGVPLRGDGPKVRVPTVLISRYLDKPVDFLKIDIEGAEENVIAEAGEKLRAVERLIIEYHSFVGHEQRLDEILGVLRRAGFRYWIQHSGVYSERPFLDRNEYLGVDMLLNIFAWRIK